MYEERDTNNNWARLNFT